MTEQQGPGEDAEGHMARREDAVDEVEGHARYSQGEQDAEDEVEGHRKRFQQDAEGVQEDAEDEVEGHGRYSQSDEGDDVEGHMPRRPL
jgi:hypothetical protein